MCKKDYETDEEARTQQRAADPFTDAASNSNYIRSNDCIIANNKVERMCNEAVMP
jgi:hypothetical protein